MDPQRQTPRNNKLMRLGLFLAIAAAVAVAVF
jgi:hypothetical protein